MSHPNEKKWVAYAKKHLVGRKIVSVRYMSDEEAGGLTWNMRPIVFQLDDGSQFYPASDDEGNGGGALFGQTTNKEEVTIPTLY